jgi:hypothetical protein
MATRILIDGKYLVADPGPSGELGDKSGLCTVEVPVNFPTYAEAFAMDPARVAAQVGLTPGLALVGSPFERSPSLEVLVKYKFQGVPTTWNPTQGEQRATYQLLGTEGDAPIGAHPKFANLKTVYGWIPDDPEYPDGPGRFPYYKLNNPANGISKAYMTESWLTTGAEFRKTYVIRTGSAPSAWNNVGAIFTNPPDLFKAFGVVAQNGRKWIKLAPQLENNLGSATRVTERFRMTGPGGALPELYEYAT